MKKTFLLVATALWVTALVVISLSCAGRGTGQEVIDEDLGSDTSDVVKEVILSSGLDEYGRPVDSTKVFNSETAEIFCTFLLAEDLCCKVVTVRWLYSEEIVGEWVENGLNINFPVTVSITKPVNGFSTGYYTLVIYVDHWKEISIPFTVK